METLRTNFSFKDILKIVFIYFCSCSCSFSPSPTPAPNTLPSLSQSPYCCWCPWVAHKCSSSNPFTIFHPVSTCFPTAVSLFHVSKLLLLFCSLVYCIHQIPHINRIMWYLFFTDWLSSLHIIFSRSSHAVAKCKNFFFLTAAQYSVV